MMEHPLEIAGLIVALLAGAAAIFLAFRLMRKYPLPFVSSFFYYLVFLYIFGVYGLTGSALLESLFVRMDTEQVVVRAAKFYAIMLGTPFLILSLYMLLRCVIELVSRKPGLVFTVTYFIHGMAAIAFYALIVVRYIHFDKGEYFMILGIQRWGFLGLLLLVHSASFILAFTGSKKLHRHERDFVRLIATIYLIYMVLVLTVFMLSGAFEFLRAAFIFIFLAGHLIPTLFMTIYLGKYHSQESFVEKEFEEQLRDFCIQYGISRREGEVISLISKGYTNQQISDALYISLQTVKDHVHRIFVKSGVKNRVQLTNMIRSEPD